MPDLKEVNWKIVLALVLNLFWPGIGTWIIGNAKLGQLQILVYLVGGVLVLSEGFGITGDLALILGFIGMASLAASWIWANYEVINTIHKKLA